MCLTLDTTSGFEFIPFSLRNGDNLRLHLNIVDISRRSDHEVIVYSLYDYIRKFHESVHGPPTDLLGVSNLEIKITLVRFSQVKVEFGAPVLSTYTTDFVNVKFVSDATNVRLSVIEGSVTIKNVDFECL